MAKAFPTFWVIVLFLGIVWLFSELGYVRVEVPWLAAILIIVAIGAIINHLAER